MRAFALLALLAAAACGVKGDPLTPAEARAQAERDAARGAQRPAP